MLSPCAIAEKFRATDVHDDTVEGFQFVPAVKRGAKAKVIVTLFRYWENKRYLLTFDGCANVQISLDADVLVGNAPCNTCSFECSTDATEIEKMMRKHKQAWNVSYQKSIDPLPKKIDSINGLVLFKVKVFGGVLQVVAKKFSIRRVAKALTA